jgi:hypothetical protein
MTEVAQSNEPLILDLVEWVTRAPRSYSEVMTAWRTSCPRLPIWEDAVDRGLVSYNTGDDGGLWVAATPLGRDMLVRAGRALT